MSIFPSFLASYVMKSVFLLPGSTKKGIHMFLGSAGALNFEIPSKGPKTCGPSGGT